jgi:hypothetical protein
MIKPYFYQGYNWEIYDNMRGMGQPAGSSAGQVLRPNTSGAEAVSSGISFEATGFTQTTFSASYPCVYIAIRRGPMKTPTDATKVFDAQVATPSAGQLANTGFPVDFSMGKWRTVAGGYASVTVHDRLRGYNPFDTSTASDRWLKTLNFAENSSAVSPQPLFYASDRNNGLLYGSGASDTPTVGYFFRRAPGFFDVVAYTGTGSATTVSHNLGAVPELIIVKRRNATADWDIYCASFANTEYVVLNTTAAKATGATRWNSATPTSSVFSVGTSTTTNASAGTYIAYLFATLNGVSKVGSYTGTGTTLQINCGFTAGSRFVMIKRTDSTGSWYVWDTARGIVSGNDSYLLLNSTAAEVTNTDYIDPLASGFEISSTAPAEINANGGSFIFLAVA